MNLAFPALCMLLLALPGVLFRQSYARASVPVFSGARLRRYAPNKQPVSIRPVAEEISLCLAWTIVLHILWLTFLNTIHVAEPKYDLIILVLHGTSNPVDKEYVAALNYISQNRLAFVEYFLSLYAMSFMLGRICLLCVRTFRLDHRIYLLRMEDQWFYFLRGEVFGFTEFAPYLGQPRPGILGTYVSIVVTQTGRDFLYKGFLWDFHLDRNGNLDRLVLLHAIRSPFAIPDASEAPAGGANPTVIGDDDIVIVDGTFRYQIVKSQLFTVRYADCKTLACSYFYIRKKRDQKTVRSTLLPQGEKQTSNKTKGDGQMAIEGAALVKSVAPSGAQTEQTEQQVTP